MSLVGRLNPRRRTGRSGYAAAWGSSLCTALVLLAAGCLPSTSPPPAPTPAAPTATPAWSADAASYLDEALDHIRARSVRAAQIDWPLLLYEVRWRAWNAQTPAETYPAIRYALQLLGDRHSSFSDAEEARRRREGIAAGTGIKLADRVIVEVIPGSPADQAGLRAGDVVESVNGAALGAAPTAAQRGQLMAGNAARVGVNRRGAERLEATLQATSFVGNRPPAGRRLDGEIGYVDLPGLGCGTPEVCQPYAETAHEILRAVDTARPEPVCGWIVDLRRNGGGNMGPMVAGIGPVLGEGEAGAFVHPGADSTSWGYRNGATFSGTVESTRVAQPYDVQRRDPPVAVLTSALTASSGEFVLLSFRGRPRTRTFGQPTAGLPTANSGKVMRDGALLNLTTALGADRTGTTYDAAIAPDETLPLDWTLIESPDDPALGTAAAWLRTQGCP